MTLVFTTVAPVFGLILIGYVAGRSGYLTEAATKGLPEFVFKVAMPVLLFRTVATARAPDAPPLDILACYYAAVAAVWLIATAATRWLLRRPSTDAPAIAMAAAFSNSVMMGLPLCLAYFGAEAGAILALIVTFDTPVLWLLAILHLGLAEQAGRESLGTQVAGVLNRLATNPIVLGTVAGVLWRYSGLELPAVIGRMVALLADAAVPGALAAMGLTLANYSIKGQTPTLTLITILKLAVMPALAWLLAAHVFMLPPLATGIVVTMAAMPVGANAFLFASGYDKAAASVSGAIALSTPLAVATISALLVLLGSGTP